MNDPAKQFVKLMSEPDPPPVLQLPTAILAQTLKVGSSDACSCGCGRPAGVLVMMPGCAAILRTPGEVDTMIEALAEYRDEVWPRRGLRARVAGLAFRLWRAWEWL